MFKYITTMFKYITTIFRLHLSTNKHWYFNTIQMVRFRNIQVSRLLQKFIFCMKKNVKYVADISFENILLSLPIRSLCIK